MGTPEEKGGAGNPTSYHARTPQSHDFPPMTLPLVTTPCGETRGCGRTAARRGSGTGAEVPSTVTEEDAQGPSCRPSPQAACHRGLRSKWSPWETPVGGSTLDRGEAGLTTAGSHHNRFQPVPASSNKPLVPVCVSNPAHSPFCFPRSP